VRTPEPPLPDDITAVGLDPEVRRDLRGLQRDTAESVARHLVAAGRLVDEDPALALEHARFARTRASRIAVVREAAGIAAYHAGEWAEALGELRAARRMGGGPGHVAVMADIERALGRPERALDLSRGPEVRLLDRAESIELAIVAAGARRDLGELDAAVVSLQIPELDPARRDPWSARLFYAYADNMLAAGRESEALQWFVHTADADDEGETDADVRIAELTGEPLPDEGYAFLDDETDPEFEAGAGDSDADESDSVRADSAGSETAAADSAGADSAGPDSAGPDSEGVEPGGTAAPAGSGATDTAAESDVVESGGNDSSDAESAGAETDRAETVDDEHIDSDRVGTESVAAGSIGVEGGDEGAGGTEAPGGGDATGSTARTEPTAAPGDVTSPDGDADIEVTDGDAERHR
jgi:hypothetical protein